MTRSAAPALLLTAAVAWIAVALGGPPEVVPESAPAGRFSAERAMSHVEALAVGPRPIGGDAHEAARRYVVEELEKLGLEPEVWTGVGKSRWGSTFGTVRNVVVRIPGTEGGGGTLVLMTHYDSVAAGPGASDAAVGVATLLETLRALRAGSDPANDVVALFTDGEEQGLLGAEAFANAHPLGKEVDLVLNFEARGTRGPSLMFETGPGNLWSIERFAEGAPRPLGASYSYEVYRRLPNDTDYSVFKDRGIAGLNFAHIHGAVGYHTAMDSIEHLDPRSLQHHGSNALGVTRVLTDADLDRAVGDRDAVYFNPLGPSFVHFPVSWVTPLLIVLALATLGVIGFGISRHRVRVGGLILGFVVQSVTLVVLGGSTSVLRGVLFPVRYDFRIWGDESSLAFTLFALTLVVLGLGAVAHRGARRFLRIDDLGASGLLLWLVVSVGASWTAPGASYLFLVPLLFQIVALGGFYASSPARARGPGEDEEAGPIGWSVFVLFALAAVAAALIWAPTLSLLAVGLQSGAAVILAVLGGLLLVLMAPQVDLWTTGALRWAVPGALVAGGVLLVAAVRLSGGFGPDNPRPNTLFYALDADSGEAVWGSFGEEPDGWTVNVLGEDPEVRPLPRILGRESEVAVAPAPALDLPAAELEIQQATDRSGGTERLRLVPPAGAARLRILLEPRAAIDGLRIEGRSVELSDEEEEPVVLLYVAPPPEGVELAIETSDPGALEVAAVAQWRELPSVGEGGPEPRGAGFMQASRPRDSDTTMVLRRWTLGERRAADEDAVAMPAEGAVQ